MQTSKLTTQLLQDLKQIKRASDLGLIIHHTPIKLSLLQKRQAYFLTDGEVIIQSQVCSFSQRHQNPTPFNRIRSDYYSFNIKHINMFIFNDNDHSAENPPYPSAYHPSFHLQERMRSFNPCTAITEFRNVIEGLQITQWAFAMVNIANSGYYGVVLNIYKYSRIREKCNITNGIHSILYEKQLADILEELRLKDMRTQVGQLKRKNPISLCYYRKNLKTAHVNKTLQSNFVTADRIGKVIKVNLQQKQYYLPLGKISGVLRFLRPLAKFSQSKKPSINFNLFRGLPEKKKSDSQSESCFSASSESSQGEELREDEILIDEEVDSREQSSEDQIEPLKMIYLKQLQAMDIK